MRRLTEAEPDDRGVATIFVILAMTAMLVGAGFAIDVGGYVSSARSAQNSADATVLAVATDCALTDVHGTEGDYSPYRKDGQTITEPYCGDGETDIMVTKEVEGLLLAQSAGDVSRRAWARWSTLGTATVAAPMIISSCEFSEALSGNLVDPRGDVVVYLDSPPIGFGCSDTAGGFGLLDAPDGTCETELTANESEDGFDAGGQPGNALRTKLVPCLTPLPKEILIPMYNTEECELQNCRVKGKGPYQIEGFALFRITGYSFGGGPNASAGSLAGGCPAQAPGMGQLSCIGGDFIKFTTFDGTPGESTDFGVTQISLFIKK